MKGLRKGSSLLTRIAIAILILSLTGGLFIIYITRTISSDAEVINNLGIIRGSIQKLVKLELANIQRDELINEIDMKIDAFDKKNIQVYAQEEKIQCAVDELSEKWRLLKQAIIEYRRNSSKANKESLIQLSEEVWVKSNTMVYTSQLVSENKINNYKISYIFSGISLLLGLLIIFVIKRYVKENLEYLVDYDDLTGLKNRRYFNNILKREIFKGERYRNKFSLVFIDIDHFKKVNDTYGHDVGDLVLKELSRLMENNIRKSDLITRIGGEEFAIIAAETNAKKAKELSEKIRKVVELHTFEKVEKITISLGITGYINGDDTDTIFKRADKALYKAKNLGRNRCEIVITEKK